MSLLLTSVLMVLMVLAYLVGRRAAVRASAGDPRGLHSRPIYHGYYVALWCGLPALALVLVWVVAQPRIVDSMVLAEAPGSVHELPPERVDLFLRDARSLASGGVASREATPELEAAAARYASLGSLGRTGLAACALALAVGGLSWARRRVTPDFRARNAVERSLNGFLVACSTVAILTTVGIVLSLIFEALRFFALVSPGEFLLGTQWSPQTALRADQVGSSGAFGAVPIFAGTLLITVIAMGVSVPVGLMAAIYLSEYARPSARATLKPILEILAGIPTVVYGFFAALTIGPVIRGLGESLGLDVASESALGAGLVMGVMIIPFVSSLSDDVISAVPQSLRDGALGLGSTRSEMIKRVVLPASLHGIVGAVLLAVSRAIGETMIVVMAAGLAANLTGNPLEAVTTVTVQIVTLLVGDQEFDSAKTLAAFALGLVLFFVTLMLNVVALCVVRRYREQYD
jgi:phosphate transport system permease protein